MNKKIQIVIACLLASTLSAQVTAVTGTSPIVSSGGDIPAISCPTCVTTTTGTITYNNHALFAGSAPAVTECGGNATMGTGSNDNAGFIQVSATPTTKPVVVCTLTFATAFTHAPAMSFTTSKNQVLASPLTITTTTVRFRLSADMIGGVITYSAF